MKKIILLTVIIFVALFSFAQTGDPLRDKLDSIFNFINKSEIPTGYLKEYGSEMLPLHLLNGLLTDSNEVESLDILRYAYADLATAKIISSIPAMLPLTTINDNIDTARTQDNTTVAVLFGQYASLKPTALSQNLLSINNQQFYDVPGRSEIPYFQNNLFVAATSERYYRDTVKLKWSTALYYTNTSATLVSLSVDFKDGNGYQAITSAGLTKVYSDSSGSKPVVYKAVFSNALTLYCNGNIKVEVSDLTAARYIDTDPYAVTININSLPGASTYNDFQDKLQIRYSLKNPTRTNSNPALRKLRKPIIYVEGYDVGGNSGISLFGQIVHGDLGNNLMDLIRNKVGNPDKGEWVNLANPPNNYDFMYDLDDNAGYDLVFVNYNTMRSVVDNALMLQQVINWVNTQKASINSPEKNVVVGVSMGGLVARYCLANMTKNVGFNSTDTKLLITHDSPHQGANVPLGFQYFLYHLAYTKILGKYVKDKNDDIRDFLKLNDNVSTQQLLKARVTRNSTGNIVVSYNSFLNGPNNPYHQMVDLTESQRPYKFVATSQGSQCGINVFDGSNITMASQDAPFTKARVLGVNMLGKKYWLNTEIKSLPTMGVSTILNYKMVSRITYFGVGFGYHTVKDKMEENPANFVGWDGAPGGTQSIESRAGKAVSGGLVNVTPWFGSPVVYIRAGLSLDIAQDQFSFVSISSALDAPEGTPLSTIFNYSMFGTNNTRVDKFVSQEYFQNRYNNFHTDYSPNNARWMYNEMENKVQQVGCTDECAPLASNYKIIGPDMVCVSAIYKLLNVPLNGTVSWPASPNYTVIPQNSNASEVLITITNPNAGSLLLSVNVQTPTTACFAATNFLISKQVQMGAPNASTFTSYITHGSNTTYMSTYCNKLTSLCEGQVPVSSRAEGKPPVINIVSPYNYCASGYITDANATSITWSMLQKSSSFHGYYNFSGNQFNVGINLNYPLEWVVLRCTRTNECGSAYTDYKFYADNKMCVGTVEERVSTPIYNELEKKPAINTFVEVSPIPSKGYLKISLVENLKSSSINQIVIKNKMGAIIYNRPFKNGQTFQNINFMVPVTDVYFLMVFDGMQWFTQKITLLK